MSVRIFERLKKTKWHATDHPYIDILGGRLNSRHGRETHATTVGTQENGISHHRQISHHKEQITMGTAHSSHPMTSPNLNKTMRALWKTTRKSIRKEHSENQITMGTAHLSHPMTSPNLNKTMRALWKTTRKSIRNIMKAKSPWARLIQHIQWHHQILTRPCGHCVKQKSSIHLSCHQQQITLCTAHSAQNGKYKRIGSQNESWTRWERDPGSASGNPGAGPKGMQQRLLSIYLSVRLSVCLSAWLSVCLSVCPSVCLSVFLSIYLTIYLSIYPSISLSIFRSIYLSTYLSIYLLSIYLSIHPSIHPSIHLSIYLFRDFPNISRTCTCFLLSLFSSSLLLFSSLLFIFPNCRKFDS